MKQVINRKGTVSVKEVPAPQCGAAEIKVALTHSLISSGTETHTLRVTGQNLVSRAKERPDLVKKVVERAKSQGVLAAYQAVKEKVNEPKAMGYSATGIVLEVGPQVRRFAPGDRVACGGSQASHAEVVCVPENLAAHVPHAVSPAHAAFTVLGSIAMQGVRRARPEFGEAFVVLGLGLVGQLCVQIAKIAGVRVMGFDLARDRAVMAKELGADEAYVIGDVDMAERVAEFTGGIGADAVLVCAGTQSSGPINDAVTLARDRGRISVVGIVGLDMQHMPAYMKELDVYMSRSYGPGRYDPDYEERGLDYPIGYVRWTENRNMAEVLRLVAEGQLLVDPLISASYPIGEADKAYAALQSDASRPLAIVLEYPHPVASTALSSTPGKSPSRRGPRQKTRLAVVGCGGFCKKDRLPYLRRLPQFELVSLISGTGAKVQELAAQYGVGQFGTDYREALGSADVDCLLVAAPNSLHGPITLAAAEAGKDLFVEKPMAVTPEELEAVYQAIKTGGIRYACGFNRRYAPASVRLKDFVAQRSAPYMVTYRCNVGLVPPGHPMHPAEEGGGLVVGEACHFFDYCTWLVGAAPVSVSATMPSGGGDRYLASDNLVAAIKFDDGSVANIVYTTMGHTGLAKERIEVYAGGAAALLDDFTAFTVYGAKDKGWSGSQDKGHKAMLEALGDCLAAGSDMPVGLEASYVAHVLTFKALESARTGAPVAL